MFTEAYLAVGGFDAPIITNEDMMMAAKLLHAGYALAYTPEAAVYHSHRYTMEEEYRRNKKSVLSWNSTGPGSQAQRRTPRAGGCFALSAVDSLWRDISASCLVFSCGCVSDSPGTVSENARAKGAKNEADHSAFILQLRIVSA